MEIENLKPKKIVGIKSLAKKIKKRDGITHTKALDAAARQAGFASYQDAFNKLERGAA